MTDAGRRRFLRQTLLGTAALFVAPALRASGIRSRVPPDITRELRFFSEDEYLVFSAAAARLTGHEAGEHAAGSPVVETALRADRFLSAEDPDIQEQFHLLLTIFSSAIAAVLFSLKFSRFVSMEGPAQDSYLEGWMTSSIGFRRTGFQALKRLAMSMYYTDAGSWEEIGYEGMGMPGESR